MDGGGGDDEAAPTSSPPPPTNGGATTLPYLSRYESSRPRRVHSRIGPEGAADNSRRSRAAAGRKATTPVSIQAQSSPSSSLSFGGGGGGVVVPIGARAGPSPPSSPTRTASEGPRGPLTSANHRGGRRRPPPPVVPAQRRRDSSPSTGVLAPSGPRGRPQRRSLSTGVAHSHRRRRAIRRIRHRMTGARPMPPR